MEYTPEQIAALVNERLDKMARDAGFDSLEAVRNAANQIKTDKEEAAKRSAVEAAQRAERAVPSELDAVLQRAVQMDPSRADAIAGSKVDHEQYAHVKTAGLRAAVGLRFKALAQLQGRGTTEQAAAGVAMDLAREARGFDREYLETVSRALAAGVFGSGGALIPDDFRAEIVPVYTANTVVRKYAKSVPMPRGSITLPRETAAVSPGFVAESANGTVSQPTTDQLILSAKKLRVVTPVSNDLLRFAGPVADTWLRNALARDMAVAEDASFIRGVGAAGTIKGLRYQALAANVTARTQAGSASTLAEIVDDLFDMILDLEENNVPFSAAWRWLSSPAAINGASKRLNSNGFFVLGETPLTGTLLGLGVDKSTSVPANLGGGDESEIYLVNYDDVVIGDAMSMEVKFSQDGAYYDGSSVLSGISRDESVFTATLLSDLGLTHEAACSIRTTVDWTDV